MDTGTIMTIGATLGIVSLVIFGIAMLGKIGCQHKWKVLKTTNVTYSTKLFGVNQGKVGGEVVLEECEACKKKRAYATDGCERYGMDVGYVERKFFS